MITQLYTGGGSAGGVLLAPAVAQTIAPTADVNPLSLKLGGAGTADYLDLVDAGGVVRARFLISGTGIKIVNPASSAILYLDNSNGGQAQLEVPGAQVRVSSTGPVLYGGGNNVNVDSANLDIDTVGKGVRVAEGANAKQGVGTLVAGTVTIANTSVTATSRILITSQADGGTPGFLRVTARVAGTSFTVTSSNAADTSTFAYEIFEPG